MRQILYTIAYDVNGELICAEDAEKGERYACPGCAGVVVPRRSVQQIKGAKRPHFAHLVKSPNCEPESVLHFGFKRLLAKRIQGHLERGEALPFKWDCDHCALEHEGNLLKKAFSVREEHSLGSCRPDIVLLTEQGLPVWALEVVVTHPPEQATLTYYKDHGIALAVFKLEGDADLRRVDAPILFPNAVDQCVNRRCKKCNRFTQRAELWVIHGACYKCEADMNVAIVYGPHLNGTRYSPEEFTDKELKLAKDNGCVIQRRYSETRGEKYLANTCTKCRAFAGEHYLFTRYVAPASNGDLRYTKVLIEYYCEHCDAAELIRVRRQEVQRREAQALANRGHYIPEELKAKEGYCIRCRTPIVRNRFKPLCAECYPHERNRERYNLPIPLDHSFCLRCGERGEATQWKPFCIGCFHIAGGR